MTLPIGVSGVIGIIAYVLFVIAPSGEPDEGILAVITWGTVLVCTAFWLVGVWKLTSPEPPSPPAVRDARLKKWIRALHVAAIICWVVVVGMAASQNNRDGADAATFVAMFGTVVLCWIVFFSGFLLLLAYFRRLTRRVVKPLLSKLTTYMFWGGIALIILFLIGAGIVAFIIHDMANSTRLMAAGGRTTQGAAVSTGIRVRPTGVIVSSSSSKTVFPMTTAPATLPSSMTTAVTTTAPTGFRSSGLGIFAILIFDAFILIWAAGWLLTLVSFRRTLKQTIHESASAEYSRWLATFPP